MKSYIKGFFHGLGSLLTGLKVTGREFFTPKVTEQYPENRATLRMFDRFCGELTMPHDAEGRNKCIACGLCQSACPNGTIRITTEVVADPETGKSASGWCSTSTIWGRACSAVCASMPARPGRSVSRPTSNMRSTRAKSWSKP